MIVLQDASCQTLAPQVPKTWELIALVTYLIAAGANIASEDAEPGTSMGVAMAAMFL